MSRIPGGQTREIMQAKEQLIHRLLSNKLQIGQIARQANCSAAFVSQVTKRMREEDGTAGWAYLDDPKQKHPVWAANRRGATDGICIPGR